MTNLKDSHPNNKSKKLGFSLIELSIVLIIIGLLVAGVTGGKSLIDSARARAFMNEIRDVEKSIWTYKAAKGRYPGDVMDYGTFGYYSNYYDPTSTSSNYARPGYTYQKTDFAPPFDTENFTPNYDSAPFVDLYTEGIIEFKPLGNTLTSDKNHTGKGTPTSRVFNKVFYYFYHSGTYSNYQGTPVQNAIYYTGIANEGSIQHLIYFLYSGANATNGMDPKILKSVDQKLDDGEYWNGKMRTSCYGKSSTGAVSDTQFGYTDYDYAIDEGKKCRSVNYAI